MNHQSVPQFDFATQFVLQNNVFVSVDNVIPSIDNNELTWTVSPSMKKIRERLNSRGDGWHYEQKHQRHKTLIYLVSLTI